MPSCTECCRPCGYLEGAYMESNVFLCDSCQSGIIPITVTRINRNNWAARSGKRFGHGKRQVDAIYHLIMGGK